MRRELDRYDMSLRAFVLGYDSWFIGTYLRAMRLAVYYKCKSHIIYKLLGGESSHNALDRTEAGFPDTCHS